MSKVITRPDGAEIKVGARFKVPNERCAFRITKIGREYVYGKMEIPWLREKRILITELAENPEKYVAV